jgi:ABC-type dipeptide/oligopeptide/nickel transport system permease component
VATYALRHGLQALLTLWFITLLTFVLAHAAPGGPFGLDDPDLAERAPPEMRERYRHLYGLDRPLLRQYADWLAAVARGDLGVSYTYPTESVGGVLARTWPLTAALGLRAGAIALLLGLPLGILAAVRQGGFADHATRGLAVIGAATPVYVLAAVLIILFGSKLHWAPLTRGEGPVIDLLASVVLAVGPFATIARFTRVATLDALAAEFIVTARGKGLHPRQILGRHVLRNALLPVLTLAGPILAHLLTGSFFVETIFNVPGAGATLVFAAGARDYPLIMAGALLSGGLIVTLNWGVDLAYGMLDPRIRVEARRDR